MKTVWPVIASLLEWDEYMVLADYRPYIDCHDQPPGQLGGPDRWTRMSILITARSGFFSSDRTAAATAATSGTPSPCPYSRIW